MCPERKPDIQIDACVKGFKVCNTRKVIECSKEDSWVKFRPN